MANSRFEYVRNFERDDSLLPSCYIVVRIDGRGFHKFAQKHSFAKPNDSRALQLMNSAATRTLESLPDIKIAYGDSDEYSFVFDKNTKLYDRRESKLITTVVSMMSASYVFLWGKHMNCELLYPPSFDGRAILYPSKEIVRDYLSWRQADCHINNLFNTTFWSLVDLGGMTPQEAESELSGSVSEGKRNEILWSRFNINYNNEPELFRKGTILLRQPRDEDAAIGKSRGRVKSFINQLHVDLIGNSFWNSRPWLFSDDR